MSEVSKNPELSNPKQSATDQDTKHHGDGIHTAEDKRQTSDTQEGGQTSDPQKGGQSNAASNYQTSDPQEGGQSSTASNYQSSDSQEGSQSNAASNYQTSDPQEGSQSSSISPNWKDVTTRMGRIWTTVMALIEKNKSQPPENTTANQNTPNTTPWIPQLITRRFVVGIFSRSSAVEYDWLEETLRSRFKDVKPCYISNNGFHQFMEKISECQCAILYHSKNRGRCNVTDVTDSLYDEELKHMSQILGKDRVWVVIDDLDDNSADVKNKFLHTQPTIQEKANDLYLIKHGAAEQKVKDLEQYEHLFNVSLTSLAVQ